MKRALVLGDSLSVWDDAAAALKLFKPDAVFATNNIGIKWKGRVDYWCSLHPMPCIDWVGMRKAVEIREAAGLNRPELWGHQCRGGIDNKTSDWGGSTGLLAVKVALEKNFERIVLAGMPLSPEDKHFYDNERPWTSATRFRRAWQKRRNWLIPRVRSMSGWTRDFLGEPYAGWLDGAE